MAWKVAHCRHSFQETAQRWRYSAHLLPIRSSSLYPVLIQFLPLFWPYSGSGDTNLQGKVSRVIWLKIRTFLGWITRANELSETDFKLLKERRARFHCCNFWNLRAPGVSEAYSLFLRYWLLNKRFHSVNQRYF